MSNQANLKNLFAGRVKLNTVLDRIEDHMMWQGKQSLDKDGIACLYYGENDRHCAIGCILPKFFKNKDIEGLRLSELLNKFPKYFGFNAQDDEHCRLYGVLSSVQALHDRSYNIRTFKKDFSEGMVRIRKTSNVK